MRYHSFIKQFITTGLILVLFPLAALAAPAKVAIFPFTINADKDYTFLQQGIVDMLSSRLALADKVAIIDQVSSTQTIRSIQGFTGDSLALMAGAKLKADFVLHGSITVLGEFVSIDAKMLDVTGTRPPLTFFKQTQGMGEVIPQINLLATDINTKVFNRQQAAGSAGDQQPPAPQQGSSSDIHMNPEKLIQEGRIIAETDQNQAQETTSALNPAFVRPGNTASEGPSFWKSRNFNHLINGIAVGDINNDGLQETVVVAPKEIYIYQFAKDRMQKLKEIKTGWTAYNLSVDIGDINGNGTPEIYVTSYNTGHTQMNSSVLEYDGTDYKTIASDLRWYFRIYRHPERGMILLAQQQLTGSDPFAGEIVEMRVHGNDFIPEQRVIKGGVANLLGFAIGDIMNDKSESAVFLNPDDHLRIAEMNGKEVWTSPDYYGGTPVFSGMPNNDRGVMAIKQYLPIRILLADLDKNGRHELIVPQNKESANRKLAQQRFFDQCQLVSKQWDGLGLAPVWQTRELSGRIQDINLSDFDNDGNIEILCALVAKEGAIIGTEPKSSLIAFDITQPAE